MDIFWRRALGDTRNRIFCLVRADLLDYRVSVEAEKQLNLLLKEKKGELTKNRKPNLCIWFRWSGSKKISLTCYLVSWNIAPCSQDPQICFPGSLVLIHLRIWQMNLRKFLVKFTCLTTIIIRYVLKLLCLYMFLFFNHTSTSAWILRCLVSILVKSYYILNSCI